MRRGKLVSGLISLTLMIAVFAVKATYSLHSLWMMRPQTSQVERAVLTTRGELQVYFQVGHNGMPKLELRLKGSQRGKILALLKIQLPPEDRYGTFMGSEGGDSRALPEGGPNAYLLVDQELGRANTMSGYMEMVGYHVDEELAARIKEHQVELCVIDPSGAISSKVVEPIQ